MNVQTNEFSIYGISISLTSNNSQFIDFIGASLQNYKEIKESKVDFQINVSVLFDAQASIKKSQFRIGNGVYLNDSAKKIAFDHKLFLGEFRYKETNTLEIQGEVSNSFSNHVKHTLKALTIKNYSYTEMLFHQLYRELVLLPFFWVLRHKFNKYLMHASAVSIGEECFVFVGNDGVGKTTAALSLLNTDGALFFGDNFLLYDDHNIYSFVDTIRVNRKECESFKARDVHSKYKNVYEEKGRIHFNCQQKYIADKTSPSRFFVLKQAEENFKQTITENEFINFTYGINNFVKEFDKFGYASSLMYLFKSSENIVEKELSALKTLIHNKPCSLLQLNTMFDKQIDVLTK